jgi:hypothetical protein
LFCGGGGAVEDHPDFVERHSENVLEDERKPFGGRQPIQYDHQRRSNGVSQFCLALRVGALRMVRRVGGFVEEFAVPGTGPQRVKTNPRHHSGQPPTHVGHRCVVRSDEAEPGFLDGVIGRCMGAEHPVCDRTQMSTVFFETGGKQFFFVHGVTSSR